MMKRTYTLGFNDRVRSLLPRDTSMIDWCARNGLNRKTLYLYDGSHISTVVRYADLLGCSVDYLLSRTDDPQMSDDHRSP